MKWRYSLRWKLPSPCLGEHELVSEVVEAGSLHRHQLCHAGLSEQGMRSVWILFLTARCAVGAKNVRLQYGGGIWINVSTGMHHCLRMN